MAVDAFRGRSLPNVSRKKLTEQFEEGAYRVTGERVSKERSNGHSEHAVTMLSQTEEVVARMEVLWCGFYR
jgi:hypothetical protein